MNEENTHSIFGASGASRWRFCSGSVPVIEEAKKNGDIPKKSQGSKYSVEGDKAHDYGHKVLAGIIQPEEVPAQFWEHLEGYVEHCRAIEKLAKNSLILNESNVPLFYRTQDQGTVEGRDDTASSPG